MQNDFEGLFIFYMSQYSNSITHGFELACKVIFPLQFWSPSEILIFEIAPLFISTDLKNGYMPQEKIKKHRFCNRQFKQSKIASR